jgi:hypothetical protein
MARWQSGQIGRCLESGIALPPFPSAQDVFSLERASFPSLSGSVQTPGENQLQLALSGWNAKKPAR